MVVFLSVCERKALKQFLDDLSSDGAWRLFRVIRLEMDNESYKIFLGLGC